jgi:hypothetical protein
VAGSITTLICAPESRSETSAALSPASCIAEGISLVGVSADAGRRGEHGTRGKDEDATVKLEKSLVHLLPWDGWPRPRFRYYRYHSTANGVSSTIIVVRYGQFGHQPTPCLRRRARQHVVRG